MIYWLYMGAINTLTISSLRLHFYFIYWSLDSFYYYTWSDVIKDSQLRQVLNETGDWTHFLRVLQGLSAISVYSLQVESFDKMFWIEECLATVVQLVVCSDHLLVLYVVAIFVLFSPKKINYMAEKILI